MPTSARTSKPRVRPPARLACGLGLLAAAAMICAGLFLLVTGAQASLPLEVAVLVAGLLEGVTAFYALQGNRAAWSFALSLNGTLFLVFLFGAPKLRDGLDVSILAALVPAVFVAVITVLLSLGSEDY